MSAVPFIFYSDQISLYSGKVRSCLRKKRLPFKERRSTQQGFGRTMGSGAWRRMSTARGACAPCWIAGSTHAIREELLSGDDAESRSRGRPNR
jgi:hypothetical protein